MFYMIISANICISKWCLSKFIAPGTKSVTSRGEECYNSITVVVLSFKNNWYWETVYKAQLPQKLHSFDDTRGLCVSVVSFFQVGFFGMRGHYISVTVKDKDNQTKELSASEKNSHACPKSPVLIKSSSSALLYPSLCWNDTETGYRVTPYTRQCFLWAAAEDCVGHYWPMFLQNSNFVYVRKVWNKFRPLSKYFGQKIACHFRGVSLF